MAAQPEPDFVVVGTGAGGLVGAIAARLGGLNPIIIEKAPVWGGTSALSGGGVWIPNNPLMKRDGVEDSLEAGLAYLDATIGDVGPASSRERRLAYLQEGPEMIAQLAELGFGWRRAPRYPDYYPDYPGGRIGRTLEGVNFDAKRLGPWLNTMRRSAMPDLALSTDAAPQIPTAFRSMKSFATLLSVIGRTIAFRLKGQVPLALGETLVAQLMVIVQKLGIPVRLNTALHSLVEENGRITAVVVKTAQGEERISTARGVLLCAGGFAKDASYRLPLQGVTGEWSPASPDDTGDAHKIGAAVGAQLALMDAATWFPVSIMPDGVINAGIWERTLPGSIIVDPAGHRFVNEAASYVDVGQAMLNRGPCWLVFDSRYRNRYFFGSTPPRMSKALVNSGFFVTGSTIPELAAKCSIDADGLVRTIARVNDMASRGVDEDFQRGNNVYDLYYGDPTHKPNAAFGTLEQAPFFATRVYPGDLSTKGGLMADEHARVLREDGSVIGGLYAAGNCAAPVMGRTYPGAGATLGPSMVFAWIAARHCAGVTALG
jgi:succinate dehydrogenase/fumarate reductase flavoprotein subunit